MKILALLLTLFALPALAGSAVLTWVAPVKNTDGSALTDLAGFNIYRGSSATTLAKIGSVTATTLTYSDASLAPGTYYYAVTAFNAANAESSKSAVVNKTVVLPKPVSPGGVTLK